MLVKGIGLVGKLLTLSNRTPLQDSNLIARETAALCVFILVFNPLLSRCYLARLVDRNKNKNTIVILIFTMLCLCTEIYVWAQTRLFKNRVSGARHGLDENRGFGPKSPPLKTRVEFKFQTELTMFMGWGLPRQKLA